jgi:hypothetical protein
MKQGIGSDFFTHSKAEIVKATATVSLILHLNKMPQQGAPQERIYLM